METQENMAWRLLVYRQDLQFEHTLYNTNIEILKKANEYEHAVDRFITSVMKGDIARAALVAKNDLKMCGKWFEDLSGGREDRENFMMVADSMRRAKGAEIREHVNRRDEAGRVSRSLRKLVRGYAAQQA